MLMLNLKFLGFEKLSSSCRRITNTSTLTFMERLSRGDCALHFTSFLLTTLSKILPCSKTAEKTQKLSVFAEYALIVYLVFYKLMLVTSIIFAEPTIKLITGMLDL